jgi:hypothetical protein
LQCEILRDFFGNPFRPVAIVSAALLNGAKIAAWTGPERACRVAGHGCVIGL